MGYITLQKSLYWRAIQPLLQANIGSFGKESLISHALTFCIRENNYNTTIRHKKGDKNTCNAFIDSSPADARTEKTNKPKAYNLGLIREKYKEKNTIIVKPFQKNTS